MKDNKKYVDYIIEQTKALLAIDSPSGYGKEVTEYLLGQMKALGISAHRTIKGGVLADFGGKNHKDAILLEAHCDTLGGMVAQIKANGRLKLTNIGGMNPANGETENVRIITKANGSYEGTCQLADASIHVNGDYSKTERSWDTVEVLIDEPVFSKEDTEKLGIMPGDYVCFEPRTRVTSSGYIKSRFLDDKLSAAILLGYGKYLRDENVVPERRVYVHFTIYEEVGHGGSSSVPEGVTEAWSVDMGCVGEGLQCTEHQVSICAKDSGGPYNYEIVCRLVELAKENNIGYAVDVYPHYGSDVETTLRAGNDVRHGLIGPGVYASHGYERSHRDGVENTLRLIQAYIG
ncbi:MAG: M42 family metallopeptidase [Lachnospiraceae bacterium]|nr:M42 family metallopeptidase [Lachnospiraceae bacterium]MDO5550433.1 M42 family metallopeptidase [Lachnospiraceae bacterium]